MTQIATPQEVLDFWYGEEMAKRWFNATPALDEEIRTRFEATWAAAAQDTLSHWRNRAQDCLALCIVLDQFPLNMFRGKPKSFSTEEQAIAVAKHAIAQGFDRQIDKARLAFLYMPLMHSEYLLDQDLSVQLFAAAGLVHNLRFAQHHQDIVRRFGRFPHRNAILGRSSTPEELAYLDSKEAFKG